MNRLNNFLRLSGNPSNRKYFYWDHGNNEIKISCRTRSAYSNKKNLVDVHYFYGGRDFPVREKARRVQIDIKETLLSINMLKLLLKELTCLEDIQKITLILGENSKHAFRLLDVLFKGAKYKIKFFKTDTRELGLLFNLISKQIKPHFLSLQSGDDGQNEEYRAKLLNLGKNYFIEMKSTNISMSTLPIFTSMFRMQRGPQDAFQNLRAFFLVEFIFSRDLCETLEALRNCTISDQIEMIRISSSKIKHLSNAFAYLCSLTFHSKNLELLYVRFDNEVAESVAMRKYIYAQNKLWISSTRIISLAIPIKSL
eukprot:snap_masked-scaffold_55-processed-gene-1.11-mRNA-1 protein AED:1.00 eAED:1.00 QI:0/0/0/0/1/1/2/0/310